MTGRSRRQTDSHCNLVTNYKSLACLPVQFHMYTYFNIFIFFIFNAYWVPIRDTDELRKHCNMSFSGVWWTMQLISGEKDWKRVSVQKGGHFEHFL